MFLISKPKHSDTLLYISFTITLISTFVAAGMQIKHNKEIEKKDKRIKLLKDIIETDKELIRLMNKKKEQDRQLEEKDTENLQLKKEREEKDRKLQEKEARIMELQKLLDEIEARRAARIARRQQTQQLEDNQSTQASFN